MFPVKLHFSVIFESDDTKQVSNRAVVCFSGHCHSERQCFSFLVPPVGFIKAFPVRHTSALCSLI